MLLLSCIGLMCGCKTAPPGPPTDSLAAVVIQEKTQIEIARTVSQVFQDAGYTPTPIPANNRMMLVFDKPGSTSANVVYGDWSGGVWFRAKVDIRSFDATSQIIECDAYRVLGRGDTRFEEENRLSKLYKGAYQDLLNKVKATLNP